MEKIYTTYIRVCVAIAMLAGLLSPGKVMAQLNPMGAVYFQNLYLANPAMAGTADGLTVNIGYRRQWNSIPQAPSTEYITGDYKLAGRVGVGLNIYNEKAGLLRATKVMGTYAYHLPLTTVRNRTLHMGLSLGLMSERLDVSEMNGQVDDATVARFNDRGMHVDGDFGLAFTEDRFKLQFAVPNVRAFVENEGNPVDRSVFFAAASYQFTINKATLPVIFEPKACVRGIKGHDPIVDAGFNVNFEKHKVNLTALYHTTRNATLGLSFEAMPGLTVMAMATTETSAMDTYSGGTYEVGLRARLLRTAE